MLIPMDQEQKADADKLSIEPVDSMSGVHSRDRSRMDDLWEFCNYYGVPCLVSDKTTSAP